MKTGEPEGLILESDLIDLRPPKRRAGGKNRRPMRPSISAGEGIG
jgi:hypothetical protein